MKICISLLIIIFLIAPLSYADSDHNDSHMGSAIVWVPVMAGVMFVTYLIFRHKKHDTNEATEILDKRYANGEISREEYLRRKKDLKK